MCGICGALSLSPSSGPPCAPETLGAMSAALRHRGPDSDGWFADNEIALAVRRLAIMDPQGADQPIASEDGQVQVIFNGEIYNHRELRHDLRRRGHRFRTGGDTEVLVHLYEERGPRFVSELRGMFALALWDVRERRLVLARDPFGIKPLLYALDDRRLAFASELRALLALPDLPRELDFDALEVYLTVNVALTPRTILRSVRRLPAGHLLIAEDERVVIERFARPLPVAATDVRRAPARELAAETQDRLRDSVVAHLQSDVPVGVLLSGGLDSGGILALAAEHAGERPKTFTVGFEAERSFDERRQAGLVASRYETEHHELIIGSGHAALLPEIVGALDEPRGDATALAYWLAARLAAQHVKVVLSGEGGDELFGGYQTYVADRHGPKLDRPLKALAPLIDRWPSSSRRLSLDFKLRRLAGGAGLPALERHHAWKEIFSADARAELLRPSCRGSADPLTAYKARYAESEGAEPLARLQDLDIGTFLADDLLTQTDRAGMAHGLEIRVPYLDPVVAELALALPVSARVRGLTTKPVLRDALAPLLPRTVVRGAKRGFCAPAAAWLRGPLEGLARDVLSPDTLRRQGLFAAAPVARLLDRHVARREDLSRQLWALLAFTLWHEAVLGPSASMRPAVPHAVPIPK
ncbi:MAG TPA: asparagine synthase (glutamine-hydrolyzing) [Solirubrobacteraceae bacterium]|jgi:asparagine synthase (glutamine-hydrolysing)